MSFEVARSANLPRADIVLANLTGALLARVAPTLVEALNPGGTLIVSGLLVHEREDVVRALGGAMVVWERTEDGWVGLAVKKP